MTLLLHKLRSFFRFPSSPAAEETTVDEMLEKSFDRLRNIDPETDREWLRLQRAIAQVEQEAAPNKSRLIPRLALAVTVIAVAAIGAYVYFSSFSSGSSSDTIVTGRGEQKDIVLDDGSQITLNYATELVVSKPQLEKQRRISLAGEAYFRIRHRETPFIISTGSADVDVVGTEFNLRAREGTLEVAVIDGIVRVSVPKDGKDSTLLLTQYQMAVCPQNDFPGRIADIPSPEYPGWMHGKLFLTRTSFQAACREVEMRFDITIAIEDRHLREKIITGILDARTAESALTALCELTGNNFTHDARAYTVH